MNFKNKMFKNIMFVLAACIVITSCQKLTRPALGDYPKDPPTPPYNALKSSFSFENNVTDDGENKLTGTATHTSYVAGITGQGLKMTSGGTGVGGYLAFDLKEKNTDPNGFVSIPKDTLSNLGSFTVAFWINSTRATPITDGAEGLFAIANNTQFWGNIEMFFENYSDATDPNAAWLKIHMLNSGVSGGGEEWTADDNTKLKNVLNKWTHLALVYDASTSALSLYKDGAVTAINNKILGGGNYGKVKFGDVSGMVIGNFAFQTTPSLTAGADNQSWAQAFNGVMDQFHLYNRPLSASEVNDLYTSKQ
jgi:hypothetical protein